MVYFGFSHRPTATFLHSYRAKKKSSEDEIKMVGGDLPSDWLSHTHSASFDDVYVILSVSDCSFLDIHRLKGDWVKVTAFIFTLSCDYRNRINKPERTLNMEPRILKRTCDIQTY